MFDWLNDLKEFFKGKKTYLLGIVAILTAIAGWASGELTVIEFAKAIWAALVAMGIRAGISGTPA
jgi:hypothetical protein